ncbi:F-box domain-containing protein [Pandoravirus kuranda]|nr:F-box domain-containing protein [Pandoravirus kuranda]
MESSVNARAGQLNLADLPDDTVIAIASWLRPRDLVALGQMAQRMHALSSASCLWKSALDACPDDAFLISKSDIMLYLTMCNDRELAEKGLNIIDQEVLDALGRVFQQAHWIDANARLIGLSGAKHMCACRVKARWRFQQPPAAVACGAPCRAEASTWLWMWSSGGDTVDIEVRRGAVDAVRGHLCGTGLCFRASMRHGDLAVHGTLGTWRDGVLVQRIAQWPMDAGTLPP